MTNGFLHRVPDGLQYLGKIRNFFENDRSADDQLIPSGMSNTVVGHFCINKWVYMGVKMISIDSRVHLWPLPNLSTAAFMIFHENHIFKNNLWCRLKFEIGILAILGQDSDPENTCKSFLCHLFIAVPRGFQTRQRFRMIKIAKNLKKWTKISYHVTIM